MIKRRLALLLYRLDDVLWPSGVDAHEVAKWRQNLAVLCAQIALYDLRYFRDGVAAPAWVVRR